MKRAGGVQFIDRMIHATPATFDRAGRNMDGATMHWLTQDREQAGPPPQTQKG